MLAGQDLTITSVHDEITVQAPRIALVAGNSSLTLDGPNIEYRTQTWTVHASGHAWEGPGGQAARIGALPDSKIKLLDEAFVIKDQETGVPLTNQAYRILRADGTYEYGTTDNQGLTHLVRGGETETLTLELVKVN